MITYMILQEFYKKYGKFYIIYEIDFIQNQIFIKFYF